jgi:hypothetical protein
VNVRDDLVTEERAALFAGHAVASAVSLTSSITSRMSKS